MKRMLKFIVLVVAVIMVTLFVIGIYKNNPRVIVSKVFKIGKVHGETFKYRIYAFGVLPIGDAVFNKIEPQEIKGQCVYHINAKARSLNGMSLFFKAKAILDSYVDCVTLNPIFFKQKLVISGKSEQEKEVTYDQKKGFMTLSGVKREILPNTQDPLSLVYNLKKMDFSKSKDIELGINTNQKNYVLKGIIEQKQINNADYKVYCGKADIRRRDKNNPYHRSQVTMWFVKEKENIPILINVFASGFYMTIRLVEIQ